MTYPPQYPQPAAPQPPQTRSWFARHKFVTVFLAVTAILVIGGIAGGSSTEDTSTRSGAATGTQPTDRTGQDDQADTADPDPTYEETADPEAEPQDVVTFRVWGDAPSGVDIMYGSDSENLSGTELPFEVTLDYDPEAMWYHVNAQLMGGGDIRCSVEVDGETAEGHAAGDYNICPAQLSNVGFGWE